MNKGRRAPLGTIARYVSQPRLSVPGLSLMATALSWLAWVRPHPGLDPSWQAGIADAFVHHLAWGPRLDFTYGPYGFAGFLEPFYLSTTWLAFVFVLVVSWSVACLIVAGARAYMGGLAAGALAWLVLVMSWAQARSADVIDAVCLAICLWLLASPAPRASGAQGADPVPVARRRSRYPVGLFALAVLGGFSLLVKLNDGILSLVLLCLAVLGAEGLSGRRRRAVLAGSGAFVATALLAWLGAGQAIGNLKSFAEASYSLVSGYSANMATKSGRHAHLNWATVAGVVIVGMVVIAFWRRPPLVRAAAALAVLCWLWVVAKDGFVSGNHFPDFFRLLLAAGAMVSIARPPPWAWRIGVLVLVMVVAASTTVPKARPGASLRAFFGQLGDLTNPARFEHMQAALQHQVARAEPLPAGVVAMVRGKTLAIEPWEDMVAWAVPSARWDPEPVLQSYSAYTAYTDRLDARWLAGASAPERVLDWHFHLGFDRRDQYMDPPATMEALYCHYDQLRLVGPWQVLARVPDRCGPARLVGVAHTHFGRVVRVPVAPGEMVLAQFVFRPTWLDQVENLALKPPLTHLRVWAGRGPRTYSFVTGTAGDDHVVSAPAALGYSGRFAPSDLSRLELLGDGYAPGQGDLTVRFWAVGLKRS